MPRNEKAFRELDSLKTVCFTIDIEPDYGGLLSTDEYKGLENLARLSEIVHKHDLKITAFVTGKTLDDIPEVIDQLNSLNAEIEQHSYFHRVGRYASKEEDIEKGMEAHSRVLGKAPLGYRAPQGIINLSEIQLLKSWGVVYDSSIFPTYFPGRFNRLSFPRQPFMYDEIGILEIPISVLPRICVPFGLSYMQLLGLNTFKFLGRLVSYPNLIIYDFHSYELGKTSSYSKLPTIEKLGYFRSQRLYDDPASVFEKFVVHLLSQGYKSRYMIDVWNMSKSKAIKFSYPNNTPQKDT